jgi:transposase
MCPVPYYAILREKESSFSYRVRMVQYAGQQGISAAARVFGTTRKTVRKWVQRYQQAGTKGLRDRSRAPHRIPHQTPPAVEEQVVRLRSLLPTWGQERLQLDFDLPCSPWAIRRILHAHGLIQPRRRKHHRKRDLRAIKATLTPFEKLQADVKELKDIPEYYPAMRQHRLPPFQYTARDVKTGALFLAFAYENTSTNATLFGAYVANHLQAHGVDLAGRIAQTDNGAEFVGSWQAKTPSPFTTLVEDHFQMEHRRIPPGWKTANSDVETSHGRIEDEFYRIETFSRLGEFLGKATTYQLYFNFQRKNRWKGRKPPWELLQAERPDLPPQVLALSPLVLDQLLDAFAPPKEKIDARGGYLVPYSLSLR